MEKNSENWGLDELTEIFNRRELHIISSRPGYGKTLLSILLVGKFIIQSKDVLFVTFNNNAYSIKSDLLDLYKKYFPDIILKPFCHHLDIIDSRTNFFNNMALQRSEQYDIIIIDDLQSIRNFESEKQIYECIETFKTSSKSNNISIIINMQFYPTDSNPTGKYFDSNALLIQLGDVQDKIPNDIIIINRPIHQYEKLLNIELSFLSKKRFLVGVTEHDTRQLSITPNA